MFSISISWSFRILLCTCFFLYFGWQHLHWHFLLYLFGWFRVDLFSHFQINVFWLFLVNSGCDLHLVVDQSLVFGNYPKVFLLFFSLVLSLIPVKKTIFFYPCLDFILLFSCIYWNSVINVPRLINLVYRFLIDSEMNAIQFKRKEHSYLNFPIAINSCLCLRYQFLLLCFYFVFILGPTQ